MGALGVLGDEFWVRAGHVGVAKMWRDMAPVVCSPVWQCRSFWCGLHGCGCMLLPGCWCTLCRATAQQRVDMQAATHMPRVAFQASYHVHQKRTAVPLHNWATQVLMCLGACVLQVPDQVRGRGPEQGVRHLKSQGAGGCNREPQPP